jgi:D-ribose pyranase
VLAAILPDLPADRLIVAEEQQHLAPARWREHQEGPLPIEAVPHLEFKHLARDATGCIRTGDSVPFANVLLVGG